MSICLLKSTFCWGSMKHVPRLPLLICLQNLRRLVYKALSQMSGWGVPLSRPVRWYVGAGIFSALFRCLDYKTGGLSWTRGSCWQGLNIWERERSEIFLQVSIRTMSLIRIGFWSACQKTQMFLPYRCGQRIQPWATLSTRGSVKYRYLN